MGKVIIPESGTRLERLAYRVDEAVKVTGLSKTTLYALMGTGRLPSCKVGNRRLIRHADIEALLAAGLAV